MKELLKAINDRYGTVNDFRTALTGGFHLGAAPQAASMPYAVFQIINNTATYNFTSTFDETEIQVDILDDNNSSDILDTADKCMALFDDCILNVAGYQFMKMEREFNFLNEDPEEELQRYTIQYIVSTRK